jgi:hypothetical protein
MTHIPRFSCQIAVFRTIRLSGRLETVGGSILIWFHFLPSVKLANQSKGIT